MVRKEFGYEHIHRRHAARFDTYCREYLNPFLSFHRPCLFASELADPKKPGRIKRVYRPRDAMTPLDKLASLSEVASFLRPDVTLLGLQQLARALTDVQAAEELREARQALFRRAATHTGAARGQRCTLPTVARCPPPLPSPACPQPSTMVDEPQKPEPNTLARLATDRLAARRRSQGAPGAYLDRKRLTRLINYPLPEQCRLV